MTQHTIAFMVLLSLLSFSGCGSGNVPFGGKVTFADGKPFTRGAVCFTNGTLSAFGPIQADGSYMLGGLKAGDGIPPGTYQVYLANFQEQISDDFADVTVYRSEIALKYGSPDTSELSCEVTRGGRYDFVVEPFKGRANQ